MAHDPTVPLLDISTLVTRAKVRIDGRNYDLRTSDEFSYLTLRGHGDAFRRMGVLMGRIRTLRPHEQKELSRLLDQFCRQMLIAPDAIHRKLSDSHRWEIAISFSQLLRQRMGAGATPAAARQRNRKTGTKRSRG